MAKTVVGSFDNYSEAQAVVDELVDIGVPRDEISIVANEKGGQYTSSDTTSDAGGTASGVGKGAVVGGAIGGAAGLAAGLAGLAIPGIGPIIAAGPIAAALAGAGAGAVAGGLIGGLTHVGVPEEDAHYYAESVRRGGALVTVRAEDNIADRAAGVMRNHNAVDVEKRAEEWKRSGWTGFDANAKPYSAADGSERVLPVVEEELNVGKRQVDRGGVRVNTRVTEQPVTEEVRLREEHARVERKPVDRPATEADLAAFKEGTIEVRESAEEAVVAKQARVVEEVRVGKEVNDRSETITDTVRRTEVDVDKVGSGRLTGSESDPRERYRTHYRTNFGSSGRSFDEYAPAYEYGSTVASDARFSGRDWSTIEPDVRREWETKNRGGAWDNFKDAVRHGWENVTGRR